MEVNKLWRLQNLKDAGYDQAMHLYMLIKLQSGIIIKAEKNHVIEIFKTSDWTPSGSEIISVGAPKVTLLEFFNKARSSVSEEVFFIYDSKTQNCQYFVKNCLRANGLWNAGVEKFVMQNAESIYKGLGLLEKVNKVVTDVASKLDNEIYGEGHSKIKKKLIFRKPLK